MEPPLRFHENISPLRYIFILHCEDEGSRITFSGKQQRRKIRRKLYKHQREENIKSCDNLYFKSL